MSDFLNNDLIFYNASMSPLFPENPDITLLNSQLEQLNVDVHTQSLQVEVEKVKR